MNFKYSAILINFFLLVFSFKAMSDNEGTKKIGSFEKWSVYAKSKSLCYMITQPEKSEGEYNLRGRVRVVVYRNNLENQNKNAVGIDFGYSFTENSNAFIEIDNKNKFKLNTFGQTAWTESNIKKDKKIIEAMIKGDKLTAFGQSKRGTKTKDTYSLNGFAKAFSKINDYCS
tara:strand:- start:1109 stop:1624 length:516 start_codon:yes stop_codon:yes gene_type:complete